MRAKSRYGVIGAFFTLGILLGALSPVLAGEGMSPPPPPNLGGNAPAPTAPPAAPTAATTAAATSGPASGAPIASSEAQMNLVVLKQAPSVVISEEPFTYRILVRNVGNTRLDNILVTDTMPDNFSLSRSEPNYNEADASTRTVRWVIRSLAPGQEMQILIEGTPRGPGAIEIPGTVTATVPHLIRLMAVKPALRLEKAAPAEALLGDTFLYRFRITNTGTGTASNVVVTDELPEGIVTLNNERAVRRPIGNLEQGRSMEFELQVRSITVGQKVNTARATGDPRLTAEATATTLIRKAELAIKKTGSSRTYLNQPIKYYIQVKNIGDAVAVNTIIVDPLPASTTFRSSSDNGQMQDRQIFWRLGNLQPGEERAVEFIAQANQIGEVRNMAQARADNAPPVNDGCTTIVEGIAAMRLECVDTVDPVMVGEETEYIVDATNTGTAAAHNVKIVVTLEDSMAYLNATGSTAPTVEGLVITFAPLAVLPAGEKAVWRVRVRALKPSDARFLIRLYADELKTPVAETESTTLYGD